MAFKKLKSISDNLRREIKVYQLVLKHPRTPRFSKWLLGLAVAYALMPFDLIPDFIPIVGHLDDLVIVPGLILLARTMIPKEIINDCWQKVREGK